jgi:uncharacterized membrane protein YoaK (UPF0700 family)
MALLAGATDVYGLAYLNNLYVSFMSGNTTMLGVALGSGDWTRTHLIAVLVGAFVAGAVAGEVLAILAGARHAAIVVLTVAAVLAVPLIEPNWTAQAFVVAMGALNASITRIGTATVSLTYVTGTLVKFGQGLGKTLCGRPAGWSWLLQAPLWFSLLAGSVGATLVRHRLGGSVVWPLPVLALLLALAAFGIRPDQGRRELPPPEPGHPPA